MVNEIVLELDNLLPHQQKLKNEAKRFNVACCGRRFGKTVLAIDLLLEPDREDNGALAGYPVAYFAPTYKMLMEVWRDVVDACKPIIRTKNEQEKHIELITGGVIDMWSLDNIDSVRGRKYKRVIVDEAAIIPYLKDAWQKVLRPLLTDLEGDAWFFSTPNGKNFFFELYGNKEKFPDKWMSWQLPTSSNPKINPAELEESRATLPALAFAQEYLAQFVVDNLTQWLYAFDEPKHVKKHLPFIPSLPVYLAWDFNREPLSCSAWQFSQILGQPSSFIHCIREFGGNMQIKELCMHIRSTYPASIFFVTGDSSGNKGDVAYESRHDSAYSLIASYLQIGRRQLQPNTSNLTHENSRLLMNTMFQNYPNLYIDGTQCPNLINDCNIATVDPDKPHALLKDRKLYKMDYFDGSRYFFQKYFQAFAHKRYFKVVETTKDEDRLRQ
ncbi:hypothetical protein [Chitinophaga parva]|uniref:hypothetical protein n=1 Tax=Chitinophaga parva TaxID=2169414 RepID=UPI0014041680|nr:hypothetical protein [Chitinophaga parva]